MIIDKTNQHTLGSPIDGYIPNIVDLEAQIYEIVPDRDNIFLYGKTAQEFLSRIQSIKLNFQDRIINVPRCIYFDNIVRYKRYAENYKSVYVKRKFCVSCMFSEECSGVNYLFLKIYGSDILRPIVSLTPEEFMNNKFIVYEPFYTYADWHGNPPKINHYKYIYAFLATVPKDTKILEIGCFIGLFVDFLIKDGYTNVVGCDRDDRFVDIGVEKGGLPLKKMDIYNQQLSQGAGIYDIIVMFGVLHNDYDRGEYDTTILEYCLGILNNIYGALMPGGHCIFTTHVFSLDSSILNNIGFSIVKTYQEDEYNSVFTYIVKKGL